MTKKLNAANFRLKLPATAPARPAAKPKRPARAPSTAAAHAFIEGDRPKRGRPRGPVPKKGVMMYVPETVHEKFRIYAQLAKRPMNDILEEFMTKTVEKNAAAIAAHQRAVASTAVVSVLD